MVKNFINEAAEDIYSDKFSLDFINPYPVSVAANLINAYKEFIIKAKLEIRKQ